MADSTSSAPSTSTETVDNKVSNTDSSNNNNPNNPNAVPNKYLTSTEGLALVPAESRDFFDGSEIYVRSQKATVIRFDYPHVYWRTGSMPENGEKHRSFSVCPHIFAVDPHTRETAQLNSYGHKTSYGATEDDIPDYLPPPPMEDDEENNNLNNENNTNNTNTDSGSNRNNLISMFAKRPAKQIYEKLEDTTIECKDVRVPQAILIEKCNRVVFNVPNKVTSLSVVNCTECTLKFQSVVGSVELIRSSDILVQCAETCDSYTLEEALDCEIEFTRSSTANIIFVSMRSEGCALIAKPDLNNNNLNNELKQEQRFTIVETDHSTTATVVENTSEDPNSNNNNNAATQNNEAPVQYKTVYKDQSFSTAKLQRSGTIGYFSNN